MKRVLVILFLFPLGTYSQGIKFAKTYGQNDYSFGQALVQLPDSGYALLGSTSAIGAGNTDIIVIRTDSLGNVIWQKDIGSPQIEFAQDIVYGLDDHLYVLSYTNSLFDSGFDIMITKLNMQGSIQWNEIYGGNDWDFGRSMVWTSDDNLVIAGETFTDSAGENDIYYFKVSSDDGSLIWEKQIGTTGTEALSDVVEDSDSNLWFLGHHENPDSNAYLLKTNQLGDTIFTLSIGDSLSQIGSGLNFDQEIFVLYDNYFGSTPDSIKLGMSKISIDSNLVWNRSLDEPPIGRRGVDILTRHNDQIIVSSKINIAQTNAMWWPFNQNGFLIIQSATTQYGDFAFDEFNASVVTSDKGLAHIGTTESWGIGFSNIWIVKQDSLFFSVDIPEEVILTNIGELSVRSFKVFPNPANSQIQIDLPVTMVNPKFLVFDNIGRLVKNGVLSGTIDISSLKTGMYYLTIFDNNDRIGESSFMKL